MQYLGAILALSGLALGQTSVVSIFGPWQDDVISYSASVINVDPSGTVMAIVCPTEYGSPSDGSDSNRCIAQSLTVTAASTTFAITTTLEEEESSPMTLTMECAIEPEADAVCTTFGQEEFPEGLTVTYSSDQYTFSPITVTAGVELLDAASTQAANSGASSVAATGGPTGSTPTQTAAPSPTESTGAAFKYSAGNTRVMGLVGAIIVAAVAW